MAAPYDFPCNLLKPQRQLRFAPSLLPFRCLYHSMKAGFTVKWFCKKRSKSLAKHDKLCYCKFVQKGSLRKVG